LPAEQQQVSPEPEFVVIPRDPEQDQFMVLACDGIWDVMSNDEVAKWVLDQTKAGCDNVGEVSELAWMTTTTRLAD
jgi:serine/threonine protein phosphatase PrpC